MGSSYSDREDITSGVPQGLILGLLIPVYVTYLLKIKQLFCKLCR